MLTRQRDLNIIEHSHFNINLKLNRINYEKFRCREFCQYLSEMKKKSRKLIINQDEHHKKSFKGNLKNFGRTQDRP